MPLQVTIPLGFLGDGNYEWIWHKPTFLNFFVYFFVVVEIAFSVYVLGDKMD